MARKTDRTVDVKVIELLNWIIMRQHEDGRCPTIAEMAKHFGKTIQTIVRHIGILRRRGVIRRVRRWIVVNDPRATKVWAMGGGRIRIDNLPKYMGCTEAIDLAEAIKAVAAANHKNKVAVVKRRDDGEHSRTSDCH